MIPSFIMKTGNKNLDFRTAAEIIPYAKDFQHNVKSVKGNNVMRG